MTATKTKPNTAAPAPEILDVAERLAQVVDELADLRDRLRWDEPQIEKERSLIECDALHGGYLLHAAFEEIDCDLRNGASADDLRRNAAVLRDVIALIRTREKVTA